jgi:hypothetical protein
MGTSPTPHDLTDKEFIESPDLWPMWPYLPMKNGDRAGYFFNSSFEDAAALQFWTGNVYDRQSTSKQPTELTVEQVLAAGWRVD